MIAIVHVENPENRRDGFIAKARSIHGNTYDYSHVIYKNAKTKVNIVCRLHGEFEQTPDRHINQKCGCPACAGNQKLNSQTFIEKARKVHGDLYDYSEIHYVNNRTPVTIVCKKHGAFVQTPSNHLRGKGCKYCANNLCATSIGFIKKARQVHGDKYDYSKVTYYNNRKPIVIICDVHGEFLQIPYVHLSGSGCPKCGLESRILKRDEQVIHQKVKETVFRHFGVLNPMYDSNIKLKHQLVVASSEVNMKRIEKKRTNHSFNTSISEQQLYGMLTQVFDKSDIFSNYVSDRYPFRCDFYIKSRDLYIELNAHWSHGHHWYDFEQDDALIETWRSGSKFYKNAAYTYAVRDVKKRMIAKQNVLNYVVFWQSDLSDARLWFEHGCPDGHDWEKEYSWLV